MNKSYQMLEKLKKWPCGLWLFSRAICFRAPYFSTIRPTFTKLENGIGEARLKKRRAVQNHIGTVHAIAMANLCEFVAGASLEVFLPATHRWIPKGMQIKYLAKANSDLVGKTVLKLDSWPDSGSYFVKVDVYDREDKVVVTADIEMHVSLNKKS